MSAETIRQLADRVSPRMLLRYADIRMHAWRDAIATLKRPADGAQTINFEGEEAQSAESSETLSN
jgi:hypothetical protein